MSLPGYPMYKDSGVAWLGEVPAHWDIRRLKYSCKVFPSNVDKKSYDDELPVLLCNYTDVYYNEEIVDGMDFMAATASVEQIAKFTLRAGDTIITKDSETADDIAISSYVPNDLPNVICGYHLSMIRPLPGIYGPFVKKIFDSYYAKSRFAVLANGLTRVGLSQYALDNVEFPLPPEEEQQRVANFLLRETAKIDALVAEQEKLIALLKEKRQALISHAVTKGFDPNAPMKDSGIEWLGQVPAHWDVRPLRTVAMVTRGASPRPAGSPEFFGGDFVPWVTVAEITKDELPELTTVSEFLTEAGMERSRVFKSGTVIYSNSGATLGVPKILRMDACANDGVVGFEQLSELVLPSFLYHFLNSLTTTMRDMVKQGSGQPNLNTDIVKAIRIGLPPIAEQKQIITSIERLASSSARLESEAGSAIDLLKERRSALISAAVTGKIDVRELGERLQERVA